LQSQENRKGINTNEDKNGNDKPKSERNKQRDNRVTEMEIKRIEPEIDKDQD
jgi:hypothetical protein